MSDNDEAFGEDQKGEMLEDEEMPTFISLSSTGKDISLPYGTEANLELLPIDNAEQNDADRPTPNEYEAQSTRSPESEEREEEHFENEEGSVYVLSSGDDNDPSSHSDDEEVDDDEDLDDEDDEDIDGEIFQISYYADSDMDEIEAEEEEAGDIEDGQLLGDFSEDEIEKVDVMSDDTALRRGPPVIVEQKRSLSLQDLTASFGTLRHRTSVTGGNRFDRVQSKVRRYIQDLKEKSRRSAENRLRALEDARRNEELEAKAREEEGEETEEEGVTEYRAKPRGGRRSLKNYAEQALKDLEIREELSQDEDELTEEEDDRCAVDSVEIKTENPVSQQNEIHRSKKPLMNGQLVHDGHRNLKIPKGITVNFTPNGQTQEQSILDVRSIGYDEYMRGSSNSIVDKMTETKKNLPRDEEDPPRPAVAEKACEAVPDIEINEVQTVEESPMEVEEDLEKVETVSAPETNDKMPEEALAEIAMMQTQLNQKTTQCKEIRDAYTKTLSENFELKQELEDLKKTLAKLTAKKQTPQLVAVAIQTDPPPLETQTSVEPKDQIIQAKENFVNPKLSTSSMGSAISTIEPWTESVGSLPTSNGSIRPLPNLTPLSNAEDSFIGVPNSPEKAPKQPSHAFQTSSRIIKMLSNLTQRKSKGENMISAINGEENPTPGVPLNTPRGSNKRKASEMPDNANSLQPPKIPHTASGSRRLHRGKSEFKYPGDYAKVNDNRNPETVDENPTEELDSGVKCFTYRDDENSLERSFLIQAEDEAKYQESLKDGERAPLGVVRECGPYLLGNVEVRMTEINGTINIWGKEVSQESNVAEDEPEDADVEEERAYDWHKTPNARGTGCGPMSCSTNKKPKIPVLRLSDSGCLKNYYSPSTSTLNNFKERENIRCTETNEGNCHCGNSRSHNKFRRFSNPGEEDHSRLLVPKSNCRCNNREHDNCDYATPCARVSRHCHGDHDCTPNSRGAGKCSRVDAEQSKTEDIFCRNQSLRFNANHCDDDNVTCRHGVRKNSDFEDDDVFKRPSTSNQRDGCCRIDNCRSCTPSLNQSTDPLVSHHPHEPPETRRRRSSGKRVRGILMDFLRGCGDCRLTNGPDNKVSPNLIPQIRIRSSTPPPTLLSQTRQQTNYGSTIIRCAHTECCATCSRKIEMAAEIETQLEIFGAEMDRLRSRSQAVLGMLNTLHSTDTN